MAASKSRCWEAANRNEAQQILANIVVFMTMYKYLAHLAGITVKLQRITVDIVEAHDMITEVGKGKGRLWHKLFPYLQSKRFNG